MDREFDGAAVTRRAFATTGLVAGFTLATGPLNAATIVTDAKGLDAGEVNVPVADGKVPAYRARPAGKSGLATILVVQEIFGVHEHIKDICRRFAHQGYYAIAPSLYARYGDPGKYDMDHVRELITDIVARVPDKEVMSDLDSTVSFASGDGGSADHLGITGFCWGGRIVWLYTAHNPAVKAGAAFYGQIRGPAQANPLRPAFPLDVADRIKAPMLGFYGGLDKGIPVSDVEDMKAALAKDGNVKSHIEVFMDAQHGFFADYRPSYNEADAKDAWKQTLAWFANYVR
ncbi:MAG TPA: dienelactone hydrolase family protein [Rhizomicrobium sp.]|nr:dienelactone hydrolase family protein [Rhizomicrobium sp.]